MLSPSLVTTVLATITTCCGPEARDRPMLPPPNCNVAASPAEAARRTFFFALPLYEMTRTREQMLSLPGARINRLLHRNRLSRPSDRTITTPNVDTLYSTAWLDLSDGPVRFAIPAMGSRYHSVQLMHAFSDAFAILRNEGTSARAFLLVGPDWSGTANRHETVVRSPTRDAWLVARTFVQGPEDLAEAQRLQSAYRLEGGAGSDRDLKETIPARPTPAQFISVANAALARGPMPSVQARQVDCLAKIGTMERADHAAVLLAPALQPAFDRHMDTFHREVSAAFEAAGSMRNGWRYPAPHIADFGTDDMYRSAMALGGLAALPISEAINPLTMRDAAGVLLHGSNDYRLRIPADVPVDAFWSVTLYESDGGGRWFLYENRLGRYAVNSVSSDIERETNGAIHLNISHRKPREAGNWLPAPNGPFLLVFRAYRPQTELRLGMFQLPAVERLTD